MADTMQVGRVLRAGTESFSIGCRTLEANLPAFGALVRADCSGDGLVYGLIYNVRVDDDPFVRQLIAAGDLDEEQVEDQRQRRQVPIEVSVLAVGSRNADGDIHHRLPPQPPATLNWVTVCSPEEVARFGASFDFLRTVLNAVEAPADELAAAALRQMAGVQESPQAGRQYLVQAGRALARLLSRDPVRLEGILHRMRS